MIRRKATEARGRSLRRSVVAFAAAAIASLGFLTGCAPSPPTSIASTGDSIAQGFDACARLSPCTSVSYATGSSPQSYSLYRRLLGGSPGLAGHEYNNAELGAHARDLFAQMALAVWQKADVVTVLIGANDACAPTVGQMTPVGQFRASIDQAFSFFFSQRPGAKIVLSSIPDIYRVWQIAHNDPRAQASWRALPLCPSMLDNPTSTARLDNLRRYFVSHQLKSYDDALASVCSKYGGCRWDGGAVTRYPFQEWQLSSYDYFHPNAEGHRALASIAWGAYSR